MILAKIFLQQCTRRTSMIRSVQPYKFKQYFSTGPTLFQRIDELKKISAEAKDQTEKLNSTYELGTLYATIKNKENSVKYFQECAEMIKEEHGEKNEIFINYLRDYYKWMLTTKNYEKSLQILLKISDLQDPKSDNHFVTTNEIGTVYQHLGKLQESSEWLKSASELQKLLFPERKEMQWMGLCALGHLEFLKGNFDASIQQYEKAAELYSKKQDPNIWFKSIAFSAFYDMAQLMKNKGNKQKALEYIRECKNNIDKNQFTFSESYQKVEQFLKQIRQRDQYLKVLNEQLALVQQKWGQSEPYTKIAMEIGITHGSSGQFADAQGKFEKCKQILSKLGQVRSVNWAVVMYWIARCKIASKNLNEALEIIQEGLSVWHHIGEVGVEERAFIRALEGEIYFELEQIDNAITSFEKALEDEKRIGRHHEIFNINFYLAGLHRMKENFEKSLQLYLQNEKLNKQYNHVPAQSIEENIVPFITQLYINLKKPDLLFPYLERQRKFTETAYQDPSSDPRLNVACKYSLYHELNGDFEESSRVMKELIEVITKNLNKVQNGQYMVDAYKNRVKSLENRKKK